MSYSFLLLLLAATRCCGRLTLHNSAADIYSLVTLVDGGGPLPAHRDTSCTALFVHIFRSNHYSPKQSGLMAGHLSWEELPMEITSLNHLSNAFYVQTQTFSRCVPFPQSSFISVSYFSFLPQSFGGGHPDPF